MQLSRVCMKRAAVGNQFICIWDGSDEVWEEVKCIVRVVLSTKSSLIQHLIIDRFDFRPNEEASYEETG